MLKIENEKQLIRFLKKIAENAVKDSQTILEKDPYVEKFKNNLSANKEKYDLDEAEDVESEEPEDEKDSEEVEDSEDNEESEDEKDSEEVEDSEDGDLTPAAKKALELPGYDSSQVPNLESLLTAINLVRAGNSLKDKKIKGELKDYFEKLDENEKSVLVLFLKELAKITTGAIDGDEAQDPGDAKSYFDIVKKDGNINLNKKQIEPSTKSADGVSPGLTNTNNNKEIEDITPPIRVNESQDISDIKRKIKLIMEG